MLSWMVAKRCWKSMTAGWASVSFSEIANALRHAPRGGCVLVRVAPCAGGIDMRVSDNGEGMSDEELPRIFERFYKGPGSSGSGLGLTIARGLVEAHGGTIRAESRLGTGTTIVCSLPR